MSYQEQEEKKWVELEETSATGGKNIIMLSQNFHNFHLIAE